MNFIYFDRIIYIDKSYNTINVYDNYTFFLFSYIYNVSHNTDHNKVEVYNSHKVSNLSTTADSHIAMS